MSLVDYFSRDPYQAAKICAKYKDEFLFATLSNIKWDAKLLQKETTVSANLLLKFYLDTLSDAQIHITQKSIHDNKTVDIEHAPLVHSTKNLNSTAKQMTNHKISINPFLTNVSSAPQDCLFQNTFQTAQPKTTSEITTIHHTNLNTNYSLRVNLTQNNKYLLRKFIVKKRKDIHEAHTHL